MARMNRFAPVSGAPSSLIGVVSGYFMLSGVAIALLTLLAPIFVPEVRAGYTSTEVAISILLSLAWAGAYFWTGILLGRASRRGAYLALGFIVLPLLSSPSRVMLAFTVLSLIVLASIWRDLK